METGHDSAASPRTGGGCFHAAAKASSCTGTWGLLREFLDVCDEENVAEDTLKPLCDAPQS